MAVFLFAKAPAPIGIPVASTSSIVIVGSGGVPSGTYNKKAENDYLGNAGGDVFYAGTGVIYNKSPDTPPNYDPYILLAPNATITDAFGVFINNNSGGWQIVYIYSNDGSQYSVNGTNPFTNTAYIPTSDWSPSITITAA